MTTGWRTDRGIASALSMAVTGVAPIATTPFVVTGSLVVRAVVPGGGNNDALPNDAPAVITVRTVPKANATGVQIGALPQIAFTEPVQHVPAGVTLTEEGGGSIGLTLSGVGPNGPIATLTPQSIVTSITIQPMAGLKYGTTYTLALSSDIVDTDVAPNPNKPLTPYTTTFTTFAPESIGQTDELFTAGGMAVIGDRAYIATPQSVGRFFTNLRLFDVSDPTSPLEIASSEPSSSAVFKAPPAFWLGLPVDVVADEASPLTGGPVVAVAVTPLAYPYHTSNVRLYDVSNEQQWRWIGAVSLGRDPSDGMIRRIEMKGDMLYAVTAGIGKGIQFVNLNEVRSAFDTALANGEQSTAYWQMQGQLNSTEGFAQEAIVQTVPVDTGSGANSQLWDLAVTDLAINTISQTAVVATGRSPLVIVSQTDGLIYNGDITNGLGGPALTSWGYGIAAGTVAGKPIAVVSAIGVEGAPVSGPHVLAVVDLSNPAAPRALALLPLPGFAGATQDVVLRDTNVFVGTNTGTFLVSIADPNSPRFVGTIPGVQGRLSFSSDSILIGTRRGLTEITNPEGGVRVAALSGPLLLIPRITAQLVRDVDPAPGLGLGELEQVGAGVREIVNEKKVPVILIGATAQVGNAILFEDGKPITPIELTLIGSFGQATIPAGTRFTRDSIITLGVSTTTTDGLALASQRNVPLGSVELVLDANNDLKLDGEDLKAAQAGKRWAFWEADSRHLSAADPAVPNTMQDVRKPTVDGLVDFATIRLQVDAPIAGIEIRMSSEAASTLSATRWSLSPKAANDVAFRYVSEESAGEAQRLLIEPECGTHGGRLLGRCQTVGGNGIRLTDVQVGSYDYLFRCEACPVDGTRRLEIVQSAIPLAPKTLHSVSIDIRPISDWVGLYSARHPDDRMNVGSTLQRVPGWQSVHSLAPSITLVVHGFAVNESNASERFLPAVYKRLYWSAAPVLFDSTAQTLANAQLQANATQVIGLLWPGDTGGIPALYFTADEFKALQTSVPLSAFLQEQKSAGRRLNIIAHSLGNMAVNGALLTAGGIQTTDRYFMIDAAVPVESFVNEYSPSSEEVVRLVDPIGAANSHGWASDDTADSYWESRFNEFIGNCNFSCERISDIWAGLVSQMNPALDPKPDYRVRWSKAAARGNSPWRGIFAANSTRLVMHNYYNSDDQVFSLGFLGPWMRSQIAQKPCVGAICAEPSLFVPDGFEWALLDWTTTSNDYASLWGTIDDGAPAQIEKGRRANQIRNWAELAFWFQPLSVAAGARDIPTPAVVNDSFTFDAGKGGAVGGYTSHTYMTGLPYSKVKRLYNQIAAEIRRP